ncbi:cytochrome B [Anaerosporomusa subterranea]|uniref:Cytochrome B n=1 Tax=Anaerosporomusa subterranea TaxID=1794912 RepID=A0A154BLC5_ANASB|nr:nickel-dependent hydrogenase large subunit [Anaerosporomusa subterranea]KYZ74774.1 cytochrome B [Anaerosporomusa subterranea]
MAVKTIFPVTRVHEPLRVDVDIRDGKVVDAWISGLLFRGFEAMLRGRDPRDAALFTQRICGICSSAHAVAASMAQQQAFGVKPTPAGQQLTNLIFAADLIQNHLRHYYILVLYDYVKAPDMPPYSPKTAGDYRLPTAINSKMLEHAKQGIEMSVRAHEMMAIFGAKAPHQQTILPTGVTETATAEQITSYRGVLRDIRNFVETIHMEDVLTIAKYYPEYYTIGAGYGNFFSYGAFPDAITGQRVYQPGLIRSGGGVESLDIAHINQEIQYSWYLVENDEMKALPAPNSEKPDAYSWIKAPRYQGMPLECGPLARGFISGEYTRGISVLDRIIARAAELITLCRLADRWLDELIPNTPTKAGYSVPKSGSGIGLTDAMRGALGHWFTIEDGRVKHYRIITPTSWNFSPRGDNGERGPVEEALIGVPVANVDDLVEVGRVIRSFDPCLTCAIHMLEKKNC